MKIISNEQRDLWLSPQAQAGFIILASECPAIKCEAVRDQDEKEYWHFFTPDYSGLDCLLKRELKDSANGPEFSYGTALYGTSFINIVLENRDTDEILLELEDLTLDVQDVIEAK